jgi:4-alpha-glucanotransferase
MAFPRLSGILLHPTSLPGRFGIGDLGAEAYRFVDFLAEAGQRLWQVLPLGPTGYGDSPYQLFSAFAGNPLLISLEKLSQDGLIPAAELASVSAFPDEYVDYGRVIPFKLGMLRAAYTRFGSRPSPEFRDFCEENSWWLDDYALFMALKQAHGGEVVWTGWDQAIASRQSCAMSELGGRLHREVGFQEFTQFEFFRQWTALKQHCAHRHIRIMGDVPIYVAHDSADVWAQPELFQLDERGNPTVVAGVPPDYFSATGQLWGNPIYRWDRMAESGFLWWIARLRAALSAVDIIRIDHFRGFEAYWEVCAKESAAVNGRWVKGPGAHFFDVLSNTLGELPIVAEDLGVITPEVEGIRTRFGFAGMAILQFAFGNDLQAPSFRPHNYPRDIVAYSGTHDNDTTVGWWNTKDGGASTRSAAEIEQERRYARDYLNTDGTDIHWVFIRSLMASVAATVLFPMQDALGLGTKARMNTPARPDGNWRWRMRADAATPGVATRLRRLTEIYGR